MPKKFFTKDLLFYIAILAFPLLQFIVFYICVNGRSLLYAFQNVETYDGQTFVTWDTSSFKLAFTDLTQGMYKDYFIRSFLVYLLTYFIGTFLGLFFSYFIYKKIPGHNFFKIVLFLPSIISAIALTSIFAGFVDQAMPDIFTSITKGFLNHGSKYAFATVIFYSLFVGFGTSILMYSNAMSAISPEIIEAGKLDGANSVVEFFQIVIPSIFPTISTFAITSVAAIFINQVNLYALFGMEADMELKTIGYSLYVETIGAPETRYPYLCAMGLCLTAVAVPLTLGVKALLEKFGPSDK